MGLEAATYVNDLVSTNPLGSDGKAQGDDHLRLVKSVLKNTFPLAVGARKFRDDTASAADTLSWTLYRHRSGVAADLAASYVISGDNASGTEKVMARLQARWDDPANGSEDTTILMKTMVAGAETIIAEMNASRPITLQTFTASGTWTKPAGCRKVIFEGVGGGGGSGGCKGAGAGNAGSTGGGGSGFWGRTGVIDVTGVASVAITVGLGGAGGTSAAPNPGGNGGDTSLTVNAVPYLWGGGVGSQGYIANPGGTGGAAGGAGGGASNIVGGSMGGGFGVKDGTAGAGGATGGNGGSNPFGAGGQGAHTAAATAVNGTAGRVYGAGGGGSVSNNAGNADGVAGSAGIMLVWEFY